MYYDYDDEFERMMALYEQAIQCLDAVSIPKVKHGEETNSQAEWLTRLSTDSLLDQGYYGNKANHHPEKRARHVCWKECVKWDKRWGNRVDKRRRYGR